MVIMLMLMLMMMCTGNLEVNEVLNFETVSTDASIKCSHDFLLKHVSTRLSLVIMHLATHCFLNQSS